MFTEVELEDAAAQYKPLVLFDIISKEEQDFETRSAKTVYQIRVLASSKAKWTEKDSIWEWGGGMPTEGLHLALLEVEGLVGKSHHFPFDSAEEAMRIFNDCNSKMRGVKAKLLSLVSMRSAADGKAEIALMKALPKSAGDRVGKSSIEIVDNLSGGKTGRVSVKFGSAVQLEEGQMYFAALKKSFLGLKLMEVNKISNGDREPVSRLHSLRLYFLKEPWSNYYVEP